MREYRIVDAEEQTKSKYRQAFASVEHKDPVVEIRHDYGS